MINSILKVNTPYTTNNNIIHVIHVIQNESERPMWSKALERSYTEFGEVLNMSTNYNKQMKQAADLLLFS